MTVEIAGGDPAVNPSVAAVLDTIDWPLFETNVMLAWREAVKRYNGFFHNVPEDKVFQVSIWTDPQAHVTAVNFETAEHARWANSRGAAFWRDKGNLETADSVESLEYNGNPADFKHGTFYEYYHSELEAIEPLNFFDSTVTHTVEERVHVSLRRVSERIKDENLFVKLPHEPEIWYGISSPEDWYDDVERIILTTGA